MLRKVFWHTLSRASFEPNDTHPIQGTSMRRTTNWQDNRACLKHIYVYIKYGLPYLISLCDVMQFAKVGLVSCAAKIVLQINTTTNCGTFQVILFLFFFSLEPNYVSPREREKKNRRASRWEERNIGWGWVGGEWLYRNRILILMLPFPHLLQVQEALTTSLPPSNLITFLMKFQEAYFIFGYKEVCIVYGKHSKKFEIVLSEKNVKTHLME